MSSNAVDIEIRVAEPRGAGPRVTAPQEAGERHRQLIAMAWIGGMLLLALAVWVVLMVGGGRDRPVASDDGLRPDLEANGPSDSGANDTDSHEPPVTAEGDTDPAEVPADEPDEETTSVTLDEVCTITLSVEEAASAIGWPWEHEACEHAPIEVEEGEEAWIVVRASMAATDFGAQDAERRADDLDVDGGVLWSTHYPSLNPDLWVVYEGPFSGPVAAREAAEAVEGEAYARALTIDEADRFCIAEDGCVGETAD